MSSYGKKPSSSYWQQNNDSLKAKKEEEENKNNSINDIVREALAGANSLPRGNWVPGKSPTPTLTTDLDDSPSGFWGSAAAAVAAAAGVALVARGLWNLASSSEPEPWTPDEREKRKMMKAPGEGYKIYRDDFESDPKAYFRRHHERRKHGR